jgi:hypothetical protein
MSAEVGPVSVRTCSSHIWLDHVRDEDKEWMGYLKPCTYPENDVTPDHRDKRLRSHPSQPLKYQPLFFPTISGVDEKVYIYVRAFSLLGMTVEEADSAFISPALYSLLKTKVLGLKNFQKESLKLFEPIFENYRLRGRFKTSEAYQFFSSRPNTIKYNKKDLVFIVLEALRQFSFEIISSNASKREPVSQAEVMMTTTSSDKRFNKHLKSVEIILINGAKYYARLSKGQLIVISNQIEKLGEGFTSNVFKVFNYSTGFFQVLKFPNENVRSQHDILNEIKIVKHLYQGVSDRVLPGILDRHQTTFSFRKCGIPRVLSLGTFYPYILSNFLDPVESSKFPPLTFLHLIEGYKELLQGLRYIHTRKILHGDIKPDNVFVKSWIPLKMGIGDFGGSVIEDEVKLDSNRFWGTTLSKSYFSSSDCMAMAQLCEQQNIKDWISVHKARDVVAVLITGLDLFSKRGMCEENNLKILTHTQQFKLLEMAKNSSIEHKQLLAHIFSLLLDLSKLDRAFIAQKLGKMGVEHPKLIDFFESGLKEDWSLRPSLDVLIDKLAQIQ